jgi:hypothetical protein
MKKIIFFLLFAISLTGKAQLVTTTSQYLGQYQFSYKDTAAFEEGRGVSFIWNNDSLALPQNGIFLRIHTRYFIKRRAVKAYLDTVGISASLPVNPWAGRDVFFTALPGLMINPTTLQPVYPDNITGLYPAGSVDSFEYFSAMLLQTIVTTINNIVLLEYRQGRL